MFSVGTFLGNTEKERAEAELWSRTESLWDCVAAKFGELSNLRYSPSADAVLRPDPSVEKLVVWSLDRSCPPIFVYARVVFRGKAVSS